MSQYFAAEGKTLWNRSNGAARLYVHCAKAMSDFTGVPSGIGPLISNHPIILSIMDRFVATSIVMVQRSGGELPALAGPAQRLSGIPAAGVTRLIELAAVHARAMPD
ncbi:DUF6086 family protein [Kibdelosporangium philippinense]|uniref:DUF6086 family protein n=1 Tax=Kibdelosporangium philippinense TaxID=211113 RepID=A0ABS8Z2L5_9PSEU|nr:DUF6086 family protein [Kibdelosporangium philippinense]MCE7001682.1 DUF6086 family protein [Kibdelosporangium philippinense]